MDPLVLYYSRQAGRGREYIGSIYSTAPFVQRGHGLGGILAGFFRTLRPILWSGAKSVSKEAFKALGREALRTGGNIVRDIAKIHLHRPQTISKHVAASTQNIIDKLRGSGTRKRKRVSSAAVRNAKRKKTTKRSLTGSKTIKRDIFS
jgi:hypothetical protein